MKPNLIFLHLPKNGGTTIDAVLNRQYPAEHAFNIREVSTNKLNTEDFKNLNARQRKKIHLLKGHLYYGLHKYLFGPTNYFTFLRKPEERIVSFYHYVLRSPEHRLYKHVTEKELSLYDFVTTLTPGDINNAQIRFISGINDREEIMLEKALENIERHFILVGLVERFDESLILLKKLCDWQVPYYKELNATKDRQEISDIDTKTREAIQEFNKGDNFLYTTMEKEFDKRIKQCKDLEIELFKLNSFNKIYANPVAYRVARKISLL